MKPETAALLSGLWAGFVFLAGYALGWASASLRHTTDALIDAVRREKEVSDA